MSKPKEPLQQKEGRSLPFHLVVGIAIYVFDALYLQQGILAFLVAAGFILTGIIKTLIRLVKRKSFSKAVIQKAGIYSLCFGAVIATIAINNKIAKGRAEVIVSSVKQYKAKYDRYPDGLSALVPEFLPSVPLAKYSFAFNDFQYWRTEGKAGSKEQDSATLLWTALPPFGRPAYNFKKDQWVYMD